MSEVTFSANTIGDKALWLRGVERGEKNATERIIKLLDACPKPEQWHLDNLICCEGRCDFAIQDYQDRLIELIKGESNFQKLQIPSNSTGLAKKETE